MNGPLSLYVEHLCQEAFLAWSMGFPRTEEPLMNHLSGQFMRGCPANVQIHGLHRQGHSNVDLHGSDFAISVTKGDFRKIAFIQLKRNIAGKAKLEWSEVNDAM